MTAETDIAAIATGESNTALEVRTALTSVLGAVPEWVQYLGRRLPDETAHAADDFFDDEDASAWTLTQVTGTTTVTEKYGVLSLRDVGTSVQDLNVVSKPMALSAPVTIEAAFRWLGPTGTGPGVVALGVTDGTTSAANSAVVNVFSSLANSAFSGGTLTSFDQGVSTNYLSRGSFARGSHLYLRFCWKAANTFRIAISPDGVSWIDLSGVDISRTITPTRFALGVSAYGGAGTIVGFNGFRVAEADLVTGV